MNCSWFPVNKPSNVSTAPKIKSKTFPKVSAISCKAFVIIGEAITFANPSHAPLITSVMSLKLNPSAFIFSVIASENS